MRKILILLTVTFVIITGCNENKIERKAEGTAPVIIGSGGGKGEFSILYARTTFKKFLRHLSFLVSSEGSDEERETIKRITALPLPVVEFKTDKDLGISIFVLKNDGTVVLNKDHLWLDKEKTQPYDTATSFSFWIRLLGAINSLPNNSIESLSKKAHHTASNQIKEMTYSLALKQNLDVVIYRGGTSENDSLTFNDPVGTVTDITTYLVALTKCSEIKTLRIHSLSSTYLKSDESSVTYQFPTRLTWLCENKNYRARASIAVTFQKNAQDKFSLQTNSIQITEDGE